MRQTIEKRQARHNSSIFELNTESVMFTDILDALKTQQPEDVLDDYRLQSVQFLRRMLEHLHELCLTKMSNKDVQLMTMRYVEAVTSNKPLKSLLIEYFGELVPEVDKLVDRLKRVNYKKFTNLIRRKLSEMFSEIMRYAYDMKMSVLVERIKEKERERTTQRLLLNFMHILRGRTLQPWAFGRIHSLYISQVRGHAHMYDRLLRGVSNLDRLARLRDLKLQAGYLSLWHRQSIQLAQDNESQICNLVKTIYLSIITVIEDEQEMHGIINLALRKISGCDTALFKVFRAVQGNTVAYEGGNQSPRVNPTSNKEAQCFSLNDNDVIYEEAEEQGIPFRTMLVPVRCSTGSTIGVFSIPLYLEMSPKVLYNIFGLARGLSDILHNIYLIRHRLNYYDRDCCRTLNQLSQKLLLKLFDMKHEEDWQQHLDTLFSQVSMDNFQILFYEENHYETFYQFINEHSSTKHVELTASAIQIFKEQFQEEVTKLYVTINRKQSGFTIFPIRQDGHVRGFIKFSYPFEVPLAGLVEVLGRFVAVLICRSSEKQEKKCEIVEVREVERPMNLVQNGLDIVRASNFEDIIELAMKSTEKVFQGERYYCTVMWPMPSSKSARYYWTIHGNIVKMPAMQGTISHLVRSALTKQKILLPQTDPLSQIVKHFPTFKNNKIIQYQNHDADMKLHTYTVRNRVDQTLFIILLGSLTDENIEKQRMFLEQVGTYIKLASERQQHIDIQTKQSPYLQQLLMKLQHGPIDYSNYYESVQSILREVYLVNRVSFYYLDRKRIINSLTCQTINFGYHLPTEAYCSSVQASQNYYMRFQNKVYLHDKGQFAFRHKNNQDTYDEINSCQQHGLVLASSPAMKAIESLTDSNYVYIPLSMNNFALIEAACQFKAEDIADLSEWLKKQMDKKMEFDVFVRRQRLMLAVRSYNTQLKAQKQDEIRQAIGKMHQNLLMQQHRNMELLKVVKKLQHRIKPLMQQALSVLKEYSIINQIRKKHTQSKLMNLLQALRNVFIGKTYILITQHAKHTQKSKTNIIKSAKNIFRTLNTRIRHTLKIAFIDVLSHAKMVKNIRQLNITKHLHSLSDIVSSKRHAIMKQMVEVVKYRFDSIIELINIVAEQLNMLHFNKEQQLLSFLKERISQPFERLHSPYETMRIEFRIGKSNDQIKWPLDNHTHFIVRLTKLKFQGKIKNNLQNLKKCVQKKWREMRERNYMKITNLCRMVAIMEENNIRYSIRCLQKNVRRCIKDDNKRSKMSLKDIESQLQQLAENVEVNNDTSRQLTELKKQIVVKEQQFQDLKMDNVIKKKTLAVAVLIGNIDDRCQKRAMGKLAIRNMVSEATRKEVAAVKKRQQYSDMQLMLRRKEGGLKMLRRSAAQSVNRQVRYGFEAVLAMAFRHIR